MHLQAIRIVNFRRLRDVVIELDQSTSMLVGANNSGKTSATHIFQLFLGEKKGRFSIYDFSSSCWTKFNACKPDSDFAAIDLPTIELDLWFAVDDANLHRVAAFIPSLDWVNGPIGVRVSYVPKDRERLAANFRDAHAQRVTADSGEDAQSKSWPRNMTDFLARELQDEYEIQYAVLDYSYVGANYQLTDGHMPHPIGNASSGAAKALDSILKVDFLNAQRNLADDDAGGGRHESLSKRLNRFYGRNLTKREQDPEAVRVLADSEEQINNHFAKEFSPILGSLEQLGYPGVANHELVVRTELNASALLSGNAEVHYRLSSTAKATDEEPMYLPDRYNGLGFKNLIFMAVEILDFHYAWLNGPGEKPPVHLIMIEEPESHLHAQLQQVFIRKIRDLLPETAADVATQFVVTTHSPHLVYENSFQNIRYFKRATGPDPHTSEVRNLSTFYDAEEAETRDFLLQYLKLTHCDLFFADGTILVEGNVERLLLPLMIERDCEQLRSCHLTILEVGGAFAHKFERLVTFLGLPTLVITDIDSVEAGFDPGQEESLAADDLETEAAEDEPTSKTGRACPVSTLGAVTSNQTLRNWAPKLQSVAELVAANDEQRIPRHEDGAKQLVRIAYQTASKATWGGRSAELVGRTLEEAFAFANLDWSQQPAQKKLGLQVRGGSKIELEELAERIHKKVNKSLDKTQFALSLITLSSSDWVTPEYIYDGLHWLLGSVNPPLPLNPEDVVQQGEEV